MNINKFLYDILTLVAKDLKLDFRRGYEYLSSIAFVTASALVISQLVSKLFVESLSIPSIWVITVFIGIFSTTNSFIREVDRRTIYGLRLLPIPYSRVFLAKTLYTYLLILTQGFIYLIFLSFFTSKVDLLNYEVITTFFIFSFHISSIASFTSALVMYSEGRSFIIPMLIFIFSLPIIPLATSLADPNIPVGQYDLILMMAEAVTLFIAFTFLTEFLLET